MSVFFRCVVAPCFAGCGGIRSPLSAGPLAGSPNKCGAAAPFVRCPCVSPVFLFRWSGGVVVPARVGSFCFLGVFPLLRSGFVSRAASGRVLLLPGFSFAPCRSRGRRGFVPVVTPVLLVPLCVSSRVVGGRFVVLGSRSVGCSSCSRFCAFRSVPFVPPCPPSSRPSSWSGSVLLLSSPAFSRAVLGGACPVSLALASFPRWCLRSGLLGALCLAGGAGAFRAGVARAGFRPVLAEFLPLALSALGVSPRLSSFSAVVRAVSPFWRAPLCPPRPSWAGSPSVRFELFGVRSAFLRLCGSLRWLRRSGGGCPAACRPLLAVLCGRVAEVLFPPSPSPVSPSPVPRA